MRTVESVLAEVYESDWSLWDVPRSDRLWDYRPETVPSAFAAIMQIETEDVAHEAYNGLLNALGHNHSGTPYPAMVDGTKFLADLVPLLDGWRLAAVLDVLTDCFLWTRGEGTFTARDGREYDLGNDTAAHVEALRPVLHHVATDDPDRPERAPAAELLEVLDELLGVLDEE